MRDTEPMYPSAESTELTAEQAKQLDDDYFGSNPFGYFSSRIDSLLVAAGSVTDSGESELRQQLSAKLGFKDGPPFISFTKADRTLQIATDAFSVRHHAAESLVRFYHAVSSEIEDSRAPRCLWAAIALGPTRTIDLVNEASARIESVEGREGFWKLVLPANAAEAQGNRTDIETALNVMGDWLAYAMSLLVRSDLNINGANNKVKHGLSVRSRNDTRVTFTTQPPNADGTVPLSSLTGPSAFDVINGINLLSLSRPPTVGTRKQGLEVTSLNLSSATLLAETSLMATVLGAMFHIAAAAHYVGTSENLVGYPSLPLGPTPHQLLGQSVLGMRFNLTLPPDGRPTDRKSGIAFQSSFVPLTGDFSRGPQTTVVDG